jgi:hypothetical protein
VLLTQSVFSPEWMEACMHIDANAKMAKQAIYNKAYAIDRIRIPASCPEQPFHPPNKHFLII